MKAIYITICIALIMMLTSCEKAFFEAEPENNPEAIFEDSGTTLATTMQVSR